MLTPDIKPPAPQELAKLFALATEVDVDLADYILLAAATGARRSELIALRWADLDLNRASVWIARGIVLGFGGLVEKDTKTHAARRVSLDPTTMAAMAAHRARAVDRAQLCGHELENGAFVFSNEADGRSVGTRTPSVGPSPGSAAKRVSKAPDCTTSATTSPPRCCPPASTFTPSPAASATATLRRP